MELGGRIDKISLKYRPSTLHGREDYPTVSKLYLADREMDKLFNEELCTMTAPQYLNLVLDLNK